MKNIKAIGLLLLAVMAGLAAAVYAAGWVSRHGNIPSNKVVVAAVDIQLGSRINQQMLTTVDWPSGSIPDGAFRDIKELEERVAKVSLLRGEAILDGKLAPVGTRGGLSAVIAEGKRAMTVRVNDVVGVAGFALPGNYVDVVLNTQRDKEGRSEDTKQISKTVLEQVLVLAVAQEAGRDATTPKVVSAVTLELAPEDAEKLDLARSVGTLSLVLRNQVDRAPVATSGVTKKELFGEKDPMPAKVVQIVQKARTQPASPPKPQPAQCVEVIQHGTRSLNCFQQ
ncbi:Flp pilus assembly protein CpaB [Noviherbaspirillum sp. CPCC 100848]|uniref:Flp pilus assembly protein CpaB n=1 Tax=Noviherbaspirillum album TaxID=3080276 RepID=A0ABU6JIU7_9BURK|nr:Flp pilus assembly protein CpaB [Noviherbaspirillum sp. CPCC 100848]MEC4723333.1 Flp pilus assembly protein CpaB [Noviherbaspirillum sp. CPCC 100848]